MRISGINLPDNKAIEYALPYIFGVGLSSSRLILKSANVPLNKKAKDLTPEEMNRVQGILDKNSKIEGELKREIGGNIKRLKEIGAWRGTRHARRLPLHGRTRVNSRTLRGNVRKTMGSGRKTTAEKT